MPSAVQSNLLLQSWERVKDGFDRCGQEMHGTFVEAFTLTCGGKLSNDDHRRLLNALHLMRRETVKRLRREGWKSFFGGYESLSGRSVQRPFRQFNRFSRENPDRFLAVAREAGELLCATPDLPYLNQTYPARFDGLQPPLFALWADAVLELSLREIPGSPLNRTARCWTWDMDWENQGPLLIPQELPIDFVTGAMPPSEAEFARSFLTGAPDVDPPFWFARLDDFASKSWHAANWVVDQLRQQLPAKSQADVAQPILPVDATASTVAYLPLESAILNALDGKALGIAELATAVGCSDSSPLYRKPWRSDPKIHVLGFMKQQGWIIHDRKVGGFYRPDRPPNVGVPKNPPNR